MSSYKDKVLDNIDKWFMRRFFVINRAEKISTENLDSEIYKAAEWAYSSKKRKLNVKQEDLFGGGAGLVMGRDKFLAEVYSKVLYAEVLPSQKIKGLDLDDKKKIQESFNRYMIRQKSENLRDAAEFYRKLTITIIVIIALVLFTIWLHKINPTYL